MTAKKDTRTPQAKSAELLVAMTGKASPAKAAEGQKAGICLYREPPRTAEEHRQTCRCLGRQGTAGPQTRGEMGNGLLWRSRWVVLLFRRLRRSPEADVHTRQRTTTGTPGDTVQNGQGHPRRRVDRHGRVRRRPGAFVDGSSRQETVRHGGD